MGNNTENLPAQTLETQPELSVISIDWQGVFGQFMNLEGLAMLGIMAFLVLLSLLFKGKGKLTSGRFATNSDKLRATNLALKQLKLAQPQPVVLWAGMPNYWLGKRFKNWSARVQTLLGAAPTVWFPHAERGILVLGAPGSGKTFSVIDRAIESGLSQGVSTIVYDKKGDQMKLHAPLAVRYGYDVHVLAPGETYSGVINPLDFLRDPHDGVMAAQIGKVILQNSSAGNGKGNEFFQTAGQMLAKGLVQLAKASKYPDLAMVYAFIQLPNFVQRIDTAVHRPDGHPLKMDRWIAASFSQLLSSKDAEKTVAGIKATAEMTYSSFIQKDLLRAFIGHSTIPLQLDGKQALFFKLDDQTRDVVGPLLAASLHLCIVKNLGTKRRNPLLYSLDEFPSLKLDQIVYWVNEYRSNGGVPILGIQSLNQLYDRYGDKKGKAIASALSTHVLFYPGDYDTAEKYSKRYGEMEVMLRNRSFGRTMGGQMGRSLNFSEQIHKKPLLSADEIMRFPQGKCVITSPAYGSNAEALFPYLLKIPVPSSDIKRAKESEALWDKQIRPQLEKRAQYHSQGIDLDQELENRLQEAYRMLPLPDEAHEPVTQSPPSQDSMANDGVQTSALNKFKANLEQLNIGKRSTS